MKKKYYNRKLQVNRGMKVTLDIQHDAENTDHVFVTYCVFDQYYPSTMQLLNNT